MRRPFAFFPLLLLMVIPAQVVLGEAIKGGGSIQKIQKAEPPKTTSSFPVKRNIVTTYFWIGQGGTSISSTTNLKSAWDSFWKKNFGGIDCPDQRKDAKKFREASLPFNDIAFPKKSRKWVYWWDEEKFQKDRFESQCKGRWVMIKFNNKVCYAQWEDVGPLRYDHAEYVFGSERPTEDYSQAGLDVSPSVRDYLGLSGLDKTDWKFVEDDQVPYGPWIEYGEQAIVYSAIKEQTAKKLGRDL